MCYTESYDNVIPISKIETGPDKEENPLAEKTYDRIVNYIIENQDKMYRLAYYYVSNRENALDIVQNAIVKALENSASLKNPDAIRTWIYRIVVHESLTFLKKQNREIACEPTELQNEVYYESAYEPGLSLYTEIHKLPPEMQTVILLRYFEELSLKEVAAVTGVNLNTVKSRLYSALGKLKKLVREVS